MPASKILDPRSLRTRTQRTSVSCKCTTIIVGTLLARLRSALLERARTSPLVICKTAEEVRDWSTVVRPLVDRKQQFDIAAREPRQHGQPYRLIWHQPAEEPVFSGIVFRGVTTHFLG
jgi:hypothetical protein